MEANFDFNKTGKRMPYTVPDGFFDEMEENILKEVNKEPVVHIERKPAYLRVVLRSIAATAAVVALFLVFNMDFAKSHTAGFPDVEQAFNKLSHEDQSYLLEVYECDIFINE